MKELEQKERHLILNEMCRGQTDRAGFGYRITQMLIRDMTIREHKKCLTNLVKDIYEKDMLVYLNGCVKQGQWLRWDSAIQTDMSWKKLLHI